MNTTAEPLLANSSLPIPQQNTPTEYQLDSHSTSRSSSLKVPMSSRPKVQGGTDHTMSETETSKPSGPQKTAQKNSRSSTSSRSQTTKPSRKKTKTKTTLSKATSQKKAASSSSPPFMPSCSVLFNSLSNLAVFHTRKQNCIGIFFFNTSERNSGGVEKDWRLPRRKSKRPGSRPVVSRNRQRQTTFRTVRFRSAFGRRWSAGNADVRERSVSRDGRGRDRKRTRRS
mmetsp:Transcript_4614/g.7294  ORF Transcript_4614/g.7294 Transcript_4614/m.7294 type:complete len:227 (-) Transcript_4614:2187-2867(-)